MISAIIKSVLGLLKKYNTLVKLKIHFNDFLVLCTQPMNVMFNYVKFNIFQLGYYKLWDELLYSAYNYISNIISKN